VTTQLGGKRPARQRRSAFRVFNVLLVATIVIVSLAVRQHQSEQKALVAIGIVAAGCVAWSFFRILRTADGARKDNYDQATSFAFVTSLLFTLILGVVQRFGFLSGAMLLVPAVIIGLWSVAFIFYSLWSH
jgi:hypothetical protein